MKRLLTLIAIGAAAAVVAQPAAQAATVAKTTKPAPLQIVALGDSYGSGTGAGDYQPGTEGSCWRSANSVSQVVTKALVRSGKKVSLTNVTCSGATVASMGQTFKGQPPQLQALRPTTDVVMLSVGTNDIEFAGYGGICFQADCTGAPTTAVLGKMPAMGVRVAKLLVEIKKRSPRAQIVLTGYGQQLTRGENATGVTLDPVCGPQVVAPAERVAGNKVMVALDATLRTAALAAKASRVNVRFVSPYKVPGVLEPAFDGHALCQSAAPYYRGFDALAEGQEGQEAVFHLNKAGQAALAGLVQRAVPTLAVSRS